MDDYKLRAHELTKTFGRRTVVKSVSLMVTPGQIVALLGPNGAGKTTTFYIIAGLISATKGSVYINDREITSFTMSQRAKMGLTYMAQEASIFRKLTVKENILVALETVKKTSMNSVMLRKESNRLMEEFGITSLRDQYAYTLSGGERRRVEIARAIATGPHFLLLDEPFAGIDPITISAITEIVHYLAKKKGIGILITDHNVREAINLADYFYIIYRGRVFISGDREKIVSSDEVKKFYLGKMFDR